MEFRHKSSSHYKQENKKHGGGSTKRGRQDKSDRSGAWKEFKNMGKEARANTQRQNIKNKREEEMKKRRGKEYKNKDEYICKKKEYREIPKIIGIIGLTSGIDISYVVSTLRDELTECPRNKELLRPILCCPKWMSAGIAGQWNQRIQFVTIDREPNVNVSSSEHKYEVLDMAKIADCVIVVMNCKDYVNDTKENKFGVDWAMNAIDDIGYEDLRLIRYQGFPNILGLLIGIEDVPSKKQSLVRKNYLTYFQSEFTKESKFFTLNKSTNLVKEQDTRLILRNIGGLKRESLSWREQRGYLLATEIGITEDNPEELKISGYLNGDYLNVNMPLHLTGFGDYNISRVEIATDPAPITLQHKRVEGDKEVEEADMSRIELANVRINIPDPFAAEQTWPTQEELGTTNELSKPKAVTFRVLDPHIRYEEDKGEEKMVDEGYESKKESEEEMDRNIYIDEDLSESEEEDLDPDPDIDIDMAHKISLKHAKASTLEERAKSDLQFPDEVDTPTTQLASQRFQRYKSMKNFKKVYWNPLENLPLNYAKINHLDNYTQSHKAAQRINSQQGLPIGGNYISIYITHFHDKLSDLYLSGQMPLIVSTLMRHECMVSVVNYKLQRVGGNESIIESKTEMEFHSGFRRFRCKPIFSEHEPGQDKFRYYRFLPTDQRPCVASIYGQIQYPPSKILAFKLGSNSLTLTAHGQLVNADAKRVIVKRVLLTGYPLRVHKKSAVVRYMFFNPKDITYFKTIDLFTRNGLRGQIKEARGTHGLMKCVFSDFIKQDDTVCLPLYKRVFPKWFESTWTNLTKTSQDNEDQMAN